MAKLIDRTLVVGAVVAAGIMSLAGGAVGMTRRFDRERAEHARQGNRFWSGLHIHGAEVEDYRSLKEMAEASNIVVLGQLTNFRLSRILETDAPENIVSYAAADVAVSSLVRGKPSGVLTVEFLLTASEPESAVKDLANSLPQTPALMFLRDKGGEESGLYRLVNSSGLWVEEAGRLLAPLAEDYGVPPQSTDPLVNAEPVDDELKARDQARDEGRLLVLSPEDADRIREERAGWTPGSGSKRDPRELDPAYRYSAELSATGTLATLADAIKGNSLPTP